MLLPSSPAERVSHPEADLIERCLEDGTVVLLPAAARGAAADGLALARLLEAAFAGHPPAIAAALEEQVLADVSEPALAMRLFPLRLEDAGCAYRVCPRAGFFQIPDLWLRAPPASAFPDLPAEGPHGPHPLRPVQPDGLVYERFDPVIGMSVSFRAIDAGRDLDLFHAWMNDGRVAFFWELAKPRQELCAYLERLRDDRHTFGLIGCFDGEEAGYFEVYWAKEDRLGAHYDAHPFDRGWHGLIGNARFLGRARTAAWLRALTHLLFLDDIRTPKVVGEPNAAHRKLLRYADEIAYRKIKEFDFPHKRAALMHCDRADFFSRVRL
jgi:acetyl CoA:N6-hydroxylysine acetyl transferase